MKAMEHSKMGESKPPLIEGTCREATIRSLGEDEIDSFSFDEDVRCLHAENR